MQRGHPRVCAASLGDDGFTLIELMIVVLIIAILIAIAIPAYLGASSRAKDRATQENLTTGLKVAHTVYVDNQDYTDAKPDVLASAASTLKFVAQDQDPTIQNTISAYSASPDYIVLSGKSGSGKCYYVADDESGSGTTYAQMSDAGGCAAVDAPLPGDAAWKQKW